MQKVIISAIISLTATIGLLVFANVNSYTTAQAQHTSSSKGLKRVPSTAEDFPIEGQNDVQVTFSKASKDGAGYWHVKGAIKNTSPNEINYLKPTITFFDKDNRIVGVSTCCYADQTKLESQRTQTYYYFYL